MDGQDQGAEYGDFSTVATIFTQGLRDLPTDAVTRVRNFLAEYLGSSQHPVPFGGRVKECEQLDAWLTASQETPYLLLAAPAGRGKSALLLHWCQSVLARRNFAVAYFPVSIRFRTNLAGVAFPALVALLAQLHGEKVPGDPNLSEEVWRGLLVDYINRPLPDGRTLLLVLDGVDEAADWSAGSALFPQDPRSGLRIVLSARYLANDAGVAAWLQRLAWTREGLASTLELYPLDRSGIASVLTQMGFPLNLLGTRVDIVSELYRLSEGDPLLVRLYVDDLWEHGNAVVRFRPEDLRAIHPGLVGYFERWWNDQRLLWSSAAPQREAIAQVVLNIFAGAFGPLSRADMLSLMADNADFSAETLELHLSPLARFVTGDGIHQGYVFSHPRLGNYFFEERLNDAERQEIEQRFLRWGEQTLVALNGGHVAPEDASAYVIQYYGAHLEHAQADAHTLLALVSDGWRRAWEKLDRANAGFLGDVERAWRMAEREDLNAYASGESIAYLSEEIRCLLTQVSINSLTSNISPRLMLEAVKAGIWTPAQGLACLRLISDLAPRARELVALVPFVQESLRADILQEALDTVLTIKDAYLRLDTLVELSPRLPEALLRQVLEMIPAIEDEADRAGMLAELAPALSRSSSLFDRVLDWAQEMEEDEYRALTLEGLAPYVSQDQQGRLLQLVGTIQEERYQAQVLIALVAYLNASSLRQILPEARVMMDSLSRLRLLTSMVFYLPEPLCVEVMQEALELAREIDDREYSVEALVKLAPFLSEENWQQALQELPLLRDERYQVDALRELVSYVPNAQLPDFLHLVLAMKSEEYRTHVLILLLPRLSEEHLEEVLDSVPAIWDERYRSELLAQFTLYSSEVLLSRLLKIIPTIQDRGYRVWLMAELEVPLTGKLHRRRQFNIASFFHSIPDEERLQTLLAIVPRLTEAALSSIFKFMLPQIFDFKWRVRSEEERAHILAKLGARLPDDWLGRAMNEVQGMSNEANQLSVLIAMVSRIRGTLLSAVLDIAREMKDRTNRALVLEVLVSSLPEESKRSLIQEMLRMLQVIKDEIERVKFFIACIPYLPATLSVARMQTILTSVQVMLDENNWMRMLIELASRIPTAAFDDVLMIVLDARGKEIQMQAFMALAAHVPESVFARFYVHVEEIPDPKWRSQISKIAMAHAPRSVLAAMLAQVPHIDDEERLREFLDILAPYASEDEFPLLWKGAHRISDEGGYVLALGALAPYVQERFFAQFWKAIQRLSNQEWRIWILRAMASQSSEKQKSQLWEAIFKVSDKAYQLRILKMLFPYVADGYFAQLWSIAQEKPDGWVSWQILEILASYVSEDFFLPFLQQVEAISNQTMRVQILALLIPRMSADHFLPLWDVLQRVDSPTSITRLFVALASYVPDRYVSHLWDALPAVKDDQMRVQIISTLCPQLTATQIAWSLEMLKEIPMGTLQLELFEALLPYLPEEKLVEILESLLPKPAERLVDVLMQATWDKKYHLQTLALLIPYLPDEYILPIVPILLIASRSLQVEEDQTWILRQLASNIPEGPLEQMLGELLNALKAMNMSSQLQVLEALLPALSTTGWKQVLDWAISELHTTENTYIAAWILKSGYALWEESASSWFYPLTHEILRLLSQKTRRETLVDLALLLPIVSKVGGAEAIMKTSSAILEIGDWWP
jgi:hypothetical protein